MTEADWIVIVDDDSANLRLASKILTEQGFRVSCLKSGEEALAFLTRTAQQAAQNAAKNALPNLILLEATSKNCCLA